MIYFVIITDCRLICVLVVKPHDKVLPSVAVTINIIQLYYVLEKTGQCKL